MAYAINAPVQQAAQQSAVHGSPLANAPQHPLRDNRASTVLQRRLAAAANARGPVQRVTIDDGDFSQITEIKKLGGKAEGAFVCKDSSGTVVVKIADRPDALVLAYNLAKDFGVTIPKGRYMELDNALGRTLAGKAATLNPELAGKLARAKAIVLWEYVAGHTLEHLRDKGTDDKDVAAFRSNPANFQEMGRMLVYDAAIQNEDRFKIAFNAPTNAGNLMIVNNRPIGVDQDFAKTSPEESTHENMDQFGGMFIGKLQSLLADPPALAAKLVEKMIGEGFAVFRDQEKPIAAGIAQGLDVLKKLAEEKNPRMQQLIDWTKTFQPDTDVDVGEVKTYWRGLLGSS